MPPIIAKPEFELFVGIDPGYSGGIVALDPEGEPVLIDNLPKEPEEAWEVYSELRTRRVLACVEWINPGFKGNGKGNHAKLYGSFQACQAFCEAAGFQWSTVMPKKWQNHFGMFRKEWEDKHWKPALKEEAISLYPDWHVTLNTCDALLIATYCHDRYHYPDAKQYYEQIIRRP